MAPRQIPAERVAHDLREAIEPTGWVLAITAEGTSFVAEMLTSEGRPLARIADPDLLRAIQGLLDEMQRGGAIPNALAPNARVVDDDQIDALESALEGGHVLVLTIEPSGGTMPGEFVAELLNDAGRPIARGVGDLPSEAVRDLLRSATPNALSAKDRFEFRGFLRAATDRQLLGILEKEQTAGRRDYVELVDEEIAGRRRGSRVGPGGGVSAPTAYRNASPSRGRYPYPESSSGYVLSRDGREVMRGTEQAIWKYLHDTHSYSVEHAVRHEGFAIEPDGDAIPNARRRPLRPYLQPYLQAASDEQLYKMLEKAEIRGHRESLELTIEEMERRGLARPTQREFTTPTGPHSWEPNALLAEAPPHDWKIHSVVDHGTGQLYRYTVSGENLNYSEDDTNRHFRWHVPSIDDERFDLTTAEWSGPGEGKPIAPNRGKRGARG